MADPRKRRLHRSAARTPSRLVWADALLFRALAVRDPARSPALRAPALTATVAAIAFSTNALAFEIHGKVINGTTGKPIAGIEVTIVDPRHGTATEEEIRTGPEGTFAVGNLNEENSLYLVQTSHGGVTYTEIVRPEEAKAHVELFVYETTTSWDSLRVSLPHLMARRSADTLSVDRIFVVSNRTNPPKTVHGDGAGFRIFLPEEKLQITSLFATTLGIPISVAAHPTGTPGVFTIDFPFKPGETQVGVSFDVGYAEGRYSYAEPLQHSLDEALIMTEDPGMEVRSDTVELGKAEDVRGFRAHRLTGLARGTTLALEFRGGSSTARIAPAQDHQIVTLAEPWQNASVIVIAAFFLLLVLVLAYVAKSPVATSDEVAYLNLRKGSIASQIARLDDLFAMGTVSDQLYRVKRSELVVALSRIMHRLERIQPGDSRARRQGKGTTHAR